MAGTLVGRPMLDRIPEAHFKRIVAGLILALGVLMLGVGFGTRRVLGRRADRSNS